MCAEIHKWLKAGVMRDGTWKRSERGTPQGGVISPLLANVYLHVVLDAWFMTEVQPRLRGRSRLIRYADDFVIVFEQVDDARRVMDVLPKRFGKCGLRLHPETTRLVRFEPPRAGDGARREGFDFLGLTHYWGKSRKGSLVVKRKTASSRFTRALRQVRQWCREHRHETVRRQHDKLAARLRGHYGYFGITGNGPMLERFWRQVSRTWFQWLGRRSNRGFTWERYAQTLLRYPLPRPRVLHSVYRAAKP